MNERNRVDEIFNQQTDAATVSIGSKHLKVKARTKLIHYNELVPHKENRVINQDAVMRIVNSIKVNGQLFDSVHVVDNGDGTYTILAGHHRHQAVTYVVEVEGLKQYEYIRCVIQDEDELDNDLLMIDSNLEREELSPYDTMIAIGKKEEILIKKRERGDLVQGKPITGTLRKIIADDSPIEDTQVGTYLRVYKKGSNNVKEALKYNLITLAQAGKLAKLGDKQDDELTKILNPGPKKKNRAEKDIHLKTLEHALQSAFATKVTVSEKSLTIKYTSNDDLNRILEIMGQEDVVNEP
ncbi:ParB/RepB/Spo0J family partition protein [Breznakia pachnodae]|uniref:ParB-like chromosome segregation protein Spo0J n=1 Tax=Breznakia pachnodae TaxID=265178 RepID=A0ABU0E6L9_9FIRM|nr:ParB/RepB/Spo0J family partition protein [Breznakia pachnodae]MDQ0362548.1 ParB-like chromosome segregation protein Spo0J [Breznakia pachnodae]